MQVLLSSTTNMLLANPSLRSSSSTSASDADEHFGDSRREQDVVPPTDDVSPNRTIKESPQGRLPGRSRWRFVYFLVVLFIAVAGWIYWCVHRLFNKIFGI